MAKRKRRTPPRGVGGRFKKRAHAVSRTRKRRSNPHKRRHVARRAHTVHRRRRSNPIRHRRARRRSNPLAVRGMVGTLKSAAWGAVGAVAVEKLLTYLPLSIAGTLLSGQMQYVTKSVAAIALSSVGSMGGFGRVAAEMAQGSLVVTLYQALHNEVLPRIGLAGLGYWGSGMVVADQGGAQITDQSRMRMGAYVGPQAGMQGVGEYVH